MSSLITYETRLRVSLTLGDITAPPPSARINPCCFGSPRILSNVFLSNLRKASYPSSRNILSIDLPAASCSASSLSMKLQPSRSATSPPTVVFPEPMNPVSATTDTADAIILSPQVHPRMTARLQALLAWNLRRTSSGRHRRVPMRPSPLPSLEPQLPPPHRSARGGPEKPAL